MVKDSLLGIALVAQRTAEPPRVLYSFPPRPHDPLGQIYKIPLNTFADMMIPDGFLRNRGFEISVDSGRYLTTGRALKKEHETDERLRFTSFPCDMRPDSNQTQLHYGTTKPESLDACVTRDVPSSVSEEEYDERMVEFFNIVFVTDGRKPLAATESEGLSSVASHFSKGLICEERRVKYVNREVNYLVRARAEYERDMCASPAREATSLPAYLEQESSLAKSLHFLYHGLQVDGGVAVMVNGHLLCHVSIWPKWCTQTVAPHQALVLLNSVQDIQRCLPLDCADVVRRVVEIADGSKSMRDLSRALAIPLATAQRVAQHLVYWRKGTVINRLNKHQKLMLAPSAAREIDFREAFQAQFGSRMAAPLSEVLYCFSQEDDVAGIRRRLENHVGDEGRLMFSTILDWLIARGLVRQVMSYYHFLPPPDNGVNPPDRMVDYIQSEYPQVKYEEIRRIYQVHKDQAKVQFCCRFLNDFIVAGPVDEWSIHAVLCANHESKEMYYDLVKCTKDSSQPTLFHLYECD